MEGLIGDGSKGVETCGIRGSLESFVVSKTGGEYRDLKKESTVSLEKVGEGDFGVR